MKVSVITLHTVSNYGSAMQTYATQKVFEKLGCDVEFVDYWRANNTPDELAAKLLESSTMRKLKPLWGLNKLTRNLAIFLIKKIYLSKESPMRRFILDNVNLTAQRYYSLNALKADPPVADIYVTGSDQVWNSIWNDGIDKAYFLDYAPKDKPRIAFAASIGRTELDDSEKAETTALLEKYKAISVREESAVKLLESMGISSELILDPTLMLEANDWRRIEDVSLVKNKPYMLIYQLHHNTHLDEYAVGLAKLKGWEIVRIGFGRGDRNRPGRCIIGASVPQFLGLFDHAGCVLTDSFHATAFSLNLGIDFVSILPDQFGTRIESITRITGTTDRLLKSYNDFEIADKIIEKELVSHTLEELREEGYCFLRKAISL